MRRQRRRGDAGLPQPTRGHGSARRAAARRHCPVPAVPRPRGGAPRTFGRPRGTPAGPPRRRSPPHGGTRSSGAAASWCPRRRGAGGPSDGAGLRVHSFAAVQPASPSRHYRFRFCSAAGAKARPGRTQHRRSLLPRPEPSTARRGAEPVKSRPHAAVRGRAARRAPRVRPPRPSTPARGAPSAPRRCRSHRVERGTVPPPSRRLRGRPTAPNPRVETGRGGRAGGGREGAPCGAARRFRERRSHGGGGGAEAVGP